MAGLTFCQAAQAQASTPIGPSQHFAGQVNGRHVGAVVYTVCPGPVSPGRTGPVESGQTLSVRSLDSGGGFTGPFSSVDAWFVPTATATPAPPSVTFHRYGATKAIPASVRVPCDGTGTVEFSSCPYLAPCAYGWVPDYVTVTFENIAA